MGFDNLDGLIHRRTKSNIIDCMLTMIRPNMMNESTNREILLLFFFNIEMYMMCLFGLKYLKLCICILNLLTCHFLLNCMIQLTLDESGISCLTYILHLEIFRVVCGAVTR